MYPVHHSFIECTVQKHNSYSHDDVIVKANIRLLLEHELQRCALWGIVFILVRLHGVTKGLLISDKRWKDD